MGPELRWRTSSLLVLDTASVLYILSTMRAYLGNVATGQLSRYSTWVMVARFGVLGVGSRGSLAWAGFPIADLVTFVYAVKPFVSYK